MIFVKNLKVLLGLSFFEKDLDTMFNNALKGKIGFLDKTHVILTQWEMSIFRKGLTHDFGKKLEISS